MQTCERPSVDLRAAMREVAASVAIVTAHSAEGPFGMTATSVTSVSLDPPSLLVCVNRSARLHRAIAESKALRINFLRAEDSELARVFGGGVKERVFDESWDAAAPFGPILDRALAHIACSVDWSADYATHTIFIGRARDAALGRGQPLLHCNGAFTFPHRAAN